MKKFYVLSAGMLAFSWGVTAQINDESFEDGPGGGQWTEASTNFGTPICDAGTCGTGGGAAVPNTGTFYVWFGGATSVETGSVEQSAMVPNGTTGALQMYVKMAVPGPGLAADKMEVRADGALIGTITSHDSATYENGYVLYSIPINSLTDGANHTFKIEAFQTTAANFSILVDDVVLVIDGASTNLFEFEANAAKINMYPNPTNGDVNLKFTDVEGMVNIKVTDMAGREVYSESVYADYGKVYTFGSDNLENGSYIVTVSQDGDILKNENLVISK
jgi:hypothetical protein